MDFFAEINSHKYIYLTHIDEPEENMLHLIIQEGIISDEEKTLDLGATKFEGYREISVTPESKAYEVFFESYIAYSVINESYSQWDDYEVFEGKVFRIYQKSRFLDYLKVDSFATEEYPGPFVHYGFCCSNHIVNVASQYKAKIKQLRGSGL